MEDVGLWLLFICLGIVCLALQRRIENLEYQIRQQWRRLDNDE
jgi:hypothetical protein